MIKWIDNFADSCLESLAGTLFLFVVSSAALVIPIIGLFVLLSDGGKAEQEFMSECLQHRPRYECVAMWRAGDSKPYPIVIPMPIPMGR